MKLTVYAELQACNIFVVTMNKASSRVSILPMGGGLHVRAVLSLCVYHLFKLSSLKAAGIKPYYRHKWLTLKICFTYIYMLYTCTAPTLIIQKLEHQTKSTILRVKPAIVGTQK